MIKRLFFLLLTVALCSCSHTDYKEEQKSDSSSPATSGVAYITAGQSVQSRTYLDSEDMSTVNWSKGDTIAVWGYNSERTPVYGSIDEGVSFALNSYPSATLDEALFIGSLPYLASDADADQYQYVVTYPYPKSTSNGVASFSIPSTQSGLYDYASPDIMYAVVTADAMQDDKSNNVAIAMKHLTHSFCVKIPEGRNESEKLISKLVVTFPCDVVGDFSFSILGCDGNGDVVADGSTPDVTLSNGSSIVTLDFGNDMVDAGDYVWFFVAPVTLDGVVNFKSYDYTGLPSNDISTTISKELVAGRVTPIDLTIPEQEENCGTVLTVSVTDNNLGEDPDVVRFIAPDNCQFALNGSSVLELPYVGLGDYSVAYLTEQNDNFSGQTITVEFDSPHALYEASISGFTAYAENRVSTAIPYLMYEDFSSLSSFNYYDNLTTEDTDHDNTGDYQLALSDKGLDGWTANRVGSDGDALRICARYEYEYQWGLLSTVDVEYKYDARVDSAPFALLKEGANATVKVSYNYTAGREAKYSYTSWFSTKWSTFTDTSSSTYTAGWTTNSGNQLPTSTLNVVKTSDSLPTTVNSSLYGSITLSDSFTISSAIPTTRASWLVTSSISKTDENDVNVNYWFYLDNVKAQIVSE